MKYKFILFSPWLLKSPGRVSAVANTGVGPGFVVIGSGLRAPPSNRTE